MTALLPLGFVTKPGDRHGKQYPFHSVEVAGRWARHPANAGQRLTWWPLLEDGELRRVECTSGTLQQVMAQQELGL